MPNNKPARQLLPQLISAPAVAAVGAGVGSNQKGIGDKMPEDACALVCGVLSFVIAIISWYVMFSGEWRGMVVSMTFTVIDFLIISYVLALKFHR